jgi:histone acetyltransferase (RNA polymerase elongator complex component)
MYNCGYENGIIPGIQREKLRVSREHSLARGLSACEIIAAIPSIWCNNLLPFIRKKPTALHQV